MQRKYNLRLVAPQGSSLQTQAEQGNTSLYLSEAKKACCQFKLSLRRLQRCFSSQRTRVAIDPLCLALDAALGSLERLPVGRSGEMV